MSNASRARLYCSVGLSLSVFLIAVIPAKAKGPIRRLKLDPNAPVVELFQGMEQGVFEVRIAPKSEFESYVFITNKTQKPLTVELPKSVAAVQILKQFQDFNNEANGNQQAGPGQAVSGQLGPFNNGQNGGQNGNNAGNPFNGNNFFSIPPEKVVQIKLHSVCLEHGKPNPHPKMTYVLRPTVIQVSNVAMRLLLEDEQFLRTDRMVIQAAAWHLCSGMSWKKLERKKLKRAGGTPEPPYFTRKQIKKAKVLVEKMEGKAKATQPREGQGGPEENLFHISPAFRETWEMDREAVFVPAAVSSPTPCEYPHTWGHRRD